MRTKPLLTILTIISCFLCFSLNAGEFETGIYKKKTNYAESDLFPPGELVTATNEKVKFKTAYSSISYTSKDVWGYRDNEGNEYRSIDFLFYKIESKGAIWLYTCTIDGEVSYKISKGLNSIPQDITTESVIGYIADDKGLAEKFTNLKKKEQKLQAMAYVNNYNSRKSQNS